MTDSPFEPRFTPKPVMRVFSAPISASRAGPEELMDISSYQELGWASSDSLSYQPEADWHASAEMLRGWLRQNIMLQATRPMPRRDEPDPGTLLKRIDRLVELCLCGAEPDPELGEYCSEDCRPVPGAGAVYWPPPDRYR